MCFAIIFHFALRHIKSFAKGLSLTKWQNRVGKVLESLDERSVEAEGIQTLVDILVASFDLFAVVDDTGAFGRQGGDEQGNTSADVGRGHTDATQGMGVVEADDVGAVRIAKNDLRTHVDEFVDEEQTALKHLLVDKHTPPALGCDNQDNTKKVRR